MVTYLSSWTVWMVYTLTVSLGITATLMFEKSVPVTIFWVYSRTNFKSLNLSWSWITLFELYTIYPFGVVDSLI